MLLVSAQAMSTGNLIWHWCCVCQFCASQRCLVLAVPPVQTLQSPLTGGQDIGRKWTGWGAWWNHLTGVLISCVFAGVSVNVNVCFCNSDLPPALWGTLNVSDTWPRAVCSTTLPQCMENEKIHAGRHITSCSTCTLWSMIVC